MNRVTFLRDESPRPAPGTWSLVHGARGPTATIVCPQCGYEAGLDHTIDAAGLIEPSLVCPTTGCGFHEYGQLIGWAEALTEAPRAPQ